MNESEFEDEMLEFLGILDHETDGWEFQEHSWAKLFHEPPDVEGRAMAVVYKDETEKEMPVWHWDYIWDGVTSNAGWEHRPSESMDEAELEHERRNPF